MLGLKQKRPGFKRPILEMIDGMRRGRDGVIVPIRRVIDRIKYRYQDHVGTEDRKVIVDKDEDLREHR